MELGVAGWLPSADFLGQACSKLSHQALHTDLDPTVTAARVPVPHSPWSKGSTCCPPLYPRPSWPICLQGLGTVSPLHWQAHELPLFSCSGYLSLRPGQLL